MVMILVGRIGQECLSVMDIRVWNETGCGDGKFFFALPLFCSELARDEHENDGGSQALSVTVDVIASKADGGTIAGVASPTSSFSPSITGRFSWRVSG
jgi:hypothetical protein